MVAQAEAHGVNGEPERASAHTHWQGGQHSAQDGHFGRLGRVWFVLLVGGIAPTVESRLNLVRLRVASGETLISGWREAV